MRPSPAPPSRSPPTSCACRSASNRSTTSSPTWTAPSPEIGRRDRVSPFHDDDPCDDGPVPPDRPSHRLDRSQLPDEFTPDTVRAMGLRTARVLSRPNNGVLTHDEQVAFDRALREVMQGSTDRLGRSLGRTRRGGPPDLDPDLRRSYARTQARLAAQARRAQENFPQLTTDWSAPVETPEPAPPEPDESTDDDVSLGTFEAEIEQTSDTLEILER